VPEIASRNHTLQLLPLIDELFKQTGWSFAQLQGIAVTSRPGLIGSLLVGVVTAKTLSLVHKIPLIGVNHLEAHLLAPFLRDEKYAPPENFTYPYLALAISGGHTQIYEVLNFGEYKILGRTVDDAAGEAFDKFAKHLGLGFPGGVAVDQNARQGQRDKYHFPRTMSHDDSYDYSFSGLKSAASRLLNTLTDEQKLTERSHLCASFQEAVVDSLMIKLKKAVLEKGYNKVVLTGGVSANSRLREVATAWAQNSAIELVIPPLRFCTDNAAMVGLVGVLKLNRGEKSTQELSPQASSQAGDFL
jgi:N6-L-threonylcarbamoyladenine synthase